MTARARQISRARLCRTLAAAALAGLLPVAGLASMPLSARASGNQTWTGDGDGTTWGDTQNWASKSVPQDGDSVTIAPTALQVRPAVTGVPSDIALQDLTLTDASLSGGAVTVSGDFSWSVSHSFATLAVPLTVEGSASFGGAGEEDSTKPMTL